MTTRFKLFIPFILEWEGSSYENDPDDPGGETRYGIDKRSHPKEDIRNLTQARAEQIYFDEYWQPAGCEDMPAKLGECVMNCRVNCGPGRVTKILARIGPRGTAGQFLDAQEDFYQALVIARPRSQKYLRGWLNRTRALRKWLKL